MLASTNLTYAYPGGQALSYPDVQLEADEQLLVLGPSGSGKSTLLKLWSGQLDLQRSTSQSTGTGNVVVAGTDLSTLSDTARDRWRGRNVGMVYQRPRLLASQTISANIALQARLAGLAESDRRIATGLSQLGIAHLAQRYPAACSLGEQQRAGILRALVHRPALILADEPTSALDRDNALRVAELLQDSARASGAMLVVVTHDDRIAPLFSRKLELSPT